MYLTLTAGLIITAVDVLTSYALDDEPPHTNPETNCRSKDVSVTGEQMHTLSYM